jgi:hypothetical protein
MVKPFYEPDPNPLCEDQPVFAKVAITVPVVAYPNV